MLWVSALFPSLSSRVASPLMSSWQRACWLLSPASCAVPVYKIPSSKLLKLWSIANLKALQNTMRCQVLVHLSWIQCRCHQSLWCLGGWNSRALKTWEFWIEGRSRCDKELWGWNGKRTQEGLGRDRQSVNSHETWIGGKTEVLIVTKLYMRECKQIQWNMRQAWGLEEDLKEHL